VSLLRAVVPCARKWQPRSEHASRQAELQIVSNTSKRCREVNVTGRLKPRGACYKNNSCGASALVAEDSDDRGTSDSCESSWVGGLRLNLSDG